MDLEKIQHYHKHETHHQQQEYHVSDSLKQALECFDEIRSNLMLSKGEGLRAEDLNDFSKWQMPSIIVICVLLTIIDSIALCFFVLLGNIKTYTIISLY